MNLFNRLRKKLPTIGRFSEIPSRLIDQTEANDRRSLIASIRYYIRERVVFLLLFPLLAAIDLVSSLFLAVGNFIGALFSSDQYQQKFIKNAHEYAVLFSKNLLGLVFSFLGIISPKLITFFFIPDREEHNDALKSGGLLYETETEVVQPETQHELQEIIQKAAATGATIMPIGAGRSQGKQYFPHPDGKKNKKCVSIDMSALNDISINEKDKTAIVEAGAVWAELQERANHKHLALKVMQASNIFSVGGSIGTNIHGWDHRSGNLANIVRWIEIVNAEGEIERIESSSPKFGQFFGGLGLFGVVVRAEIELTDNEHLVEKSKEVSIDDYVKHFRDHVQVDDSIRMHLFRLSLDPNNLLGTGVAVDYAKIDDSAPVKTINLTNEAERGTRLDRVLVNLARKFSFIRKYYWNSEHDRLLNHEASMTTNEIMQPPINAMFNGSVSESEWLQEYFLPEENLAAFIKELGPLLMENDVALLNSSVRFVKQDKHSALGYASGGDRFAVVLCFNQSLKMSEIVKTKKWVRQAIDLAIKHGGSFYLPYQQFASQQQFERAYPQMPSFQDAKNTADPDRLFSSGFYQQYIAPKAEKPNYFRDLLTNTDAREHFKGFLENVLQRVESEELYALLDDILLYNDTHEEIYKELLRRIPDIMPNTLSSLRKILGSLSSIKADLAGQAKALLPDVKTIDGVVEIGYPGRFVHGFKNDFTVTGPITAVYEAQSATDYIQTGFPRPYDHFVKLDYNMPDLSSIPTDSADVVTCYVGLHHFPEAQLDQFLENVRRILRPNGHFILVDHDVTNDESMVMANMAHSIFNAVNGASVEEEMNEVRNFHPMAYWQEKLSQHGLGDAASGPELEMIRQGDPSRNTMRSFVKPLPNPLSQLRQQVAKQAVDDIVQETDVYGALFRTEAEHTSREQPHLSDDELNAVDLEKKAEKPGNTPKALVRKGYRDLSIEIPEPEREDLLKP